MVQQNRLNNVRTKSKERTGKQSEWIKVKGESRKKVRKDKVCKEVVHCCSWLFLSV